MTGCKIVKNPAIATRSMRAAPRAASTARVKPRRSQSVPARYPKSRRLISTAGMPAAAATSRAGHGRSVTTRATGGPRSMIAPSTVPVPEASTAIASAAGEEAPSDAFLLIKTAPVVRVLEHPQPRARRKVLPGGRQPGPLPELVRHPLRVRHHRQVAPIGRGQRGGAAGAAVRVERIAFGRLAVWVGEAQRDQGRVDGARRQVQPALAVRHPDAEPGAFHAAQEDRRAR